MAQFVLILLFYRVIKTVDLLIYIVSSCIIPMLGIDSSLHNVDEGTTTLLQCELPDIYISYYEERLHQGAVITNGTPRHGGKPRRVTNTNFHLDTESNSHPPLYYRAVCKCYQTEKFGRISANIDTNEIKLEIR